MTRLSKITSLLLTSCAFSLSGVANSHAAELVSLVPLSSSAGELAVDIELAHGKSAIGSHRMFMA